jgi:hypothetical protein
VLTNVVLRRKIFSRPSQIGGDGSGASVSALCMAWGLPPWRARPKGAALVCGLVGFNLGMEIGQLLFVAVFLPALMWLPRGRGARLTPRIASLTVATLKASQSCRRAIRSYRTGPRVSLS